MLMLPVIIGTSLWVFFDAKKLGVRSGLITGMANLGPGAWLFWCLFLWIVAFPLYLIKRGDLKRAIQASQTTTAPLVSGSLDDLEKLATLKEKGILSEEEFQAKKKEILG